MLSSQVSGQVTACILLGLLMTCFDPGKTLLRPVLFVPSQAFDARDNSSIYLDNKAINTFLCILTQETTPHLHINFLKSKMLSNCPCNKDYFPPADRSPCNAHAAGALFCSLSRHAHPTACLCCSSWLCNESPSNYVANTMALEMRVKKYIWMVYDLPVGMQMFGNCICVCFAAGVYVYGNI